MEEYKGTIMMIILAGNGDRENRGCEAITLTTVDLLKNNIPEADICILSFDVKTDKYYEKKRDVKVLPASVPEPEGLKRIINKFRRKLTPWDLYAKYDTLVPYINTVRGADVILSLGGDNYSDEYGLPTVYWGLAEVAKRFGKKFVIWGASVGPFNRPQSLKVAKKSLKYVDLITARDSHTVAYLEELKYGGSYVRVSDSAFLLKPEEACLPKLDPSKQTIGFNISPLYYRFTGKTQEEILNISIAFLKKMSEIYNIVLVPHVVSEKKLLRNDAVYMRKIIEALTQVVMADPSYGSSQLKYIISKCDFFIGARTHSTIAALSSGVPTLTLSYSIKAIGMNADIFGSKDFLIEASEFSLENLDSKFQKLVKDQEQIRTILRDRKNDIENMAMPGIKALLDLMKDRKNDMAK